MRSVGSFPPEFKDGADLSQLSSRWMVWEIHPGAVFVLTFLKSRGF